MPTKLQQKHQMFATITVDPVMRKLIDESVSNSLNMILGQQ